MVVPGARTKILFVDAHSNKKSEWPDLVLNAENMRETMTLLKAKGVKILFDIPNKPLLHPFHLSASFEDSEGNVIWLKPEYLGGRFSDFSSSA